MYTAKVIYPSQNPRLLSVMESKPNPRIPFGFSLYTLGLQPRHPEHKATVDLRGKSSNQDTEMLLSKPSDIT